MVILRYFRIVNSLSTWKLGKEQLAIPQEHTKRYIKDIKEGKGFPSFWLPSTPEDLERISLGSLLRKGHLDNVRLIGLDECCFRDVGIQMNRVVDENFPISTVSHLHYEACTIDEDKLEAAIEIFFKCNGKFEEFFKSNPKTNNMGKIAAKYIDEVRTEYKLNAQKWGKAYLHQLNEDEHKLEP